MKKISNKNIIYYISITVGVVLIGFILYIGFWSLVWKNMFSDKNCHELMKVQDINNDSRGTLYVYDMTCHFSGPWGEKHVNATVFKMYEGDMFKDGIYLGEVFFNGTDEDQPLFFNRVIKEHDYYIETDELLPYTYTPGTQDLLFTIEPAPVNLGVYSNKKYGFEFKHAPSRCLLSQEQTSGFYVEIYQDGQCPTIQERGGYLSTLTFKYSYDLISVIDSDLSAKEYVKEEFSRIKTQKSIRINNIDWEIVNLNCDVNEGEPPICYGIETFYISKNNKNGLIYSIASRDENSAENIAKEWINL